MRLISAGFLCVLALIGMIGLMQSTVHVSTASQITPEDTASSFDGCSAPSQTGFVPYMVRSGDRLIDLIVGVDNLTITQIAALNCLDDTLSLPIGAVIWLPENHMGTQVLLSSTQSNPEIRTAFIASFEANAHDLRNQRGVILSWAAEGSEAYLYSCPGNTDLDCIRPFEAVQVPLAGSVTIRGFVYATSLRYRLEVVGRNSLQTQDVSVDVICSHTWIAPTNRPERCAEEPAAPVFAAWQPFEGGIMLWFADTKEIYVLSNQGQHVAVYEDPYTDQSNPTLTPPRNRVVPVRGFGQLWLRLGGPASSLGWATAPEIGFDSARQLAGRRSFTTYIQGPGATVYAVTLIEDNGNWIQVAG